MSELFWKKFEEIVSQIGPELKRLSKIIEIQRLSEEAHEKIVRQIFPGAEDEAVDFVVCNCSQINPICYLRWWYVIMRNIEDSYDLYSVIAKEVINDPNPFRRATLYDPNPLGRVISYEPESLMMDCVIRHEDAMFMWHEEVDSQRREFEKTLKAWVGLFVSDESISEHYYQVISHALSSYYIIMRKPRRAIK